MLVVENIENIEIYQKELLKTLKIPLPLDTCY